MLTSSALSLVRDYWTAGFSACSTTLVVAVEEEKEADTLEAPVTYRVIEDDGLLMQATFE